MKKFLLTIAILTSAAGVVAAATYSSGYSKNLQSCNPYIEKYKVQIPTEDQNTPVLNLHSTETILGWRDGKCVTTSMVYSDDLQQDILETKCAFSKNQLESIVKKINLANNGDKKASEGLKNELTSYTQDGTTCKVNNLIKEN